jgi:hypothetical protein
MSAASRAKAALKAQESALAFFAALGAGADEWLDKHGFTAEQRAVMKAEASARYNERAKIAPFEPVPHWVLPIGEALVDPDYFYPPTAELNGKIAPVLSVRAFHHSIPEGVTFERAALGAPWVRVA